MSVFDLIEYLRKEEEHLLPEPPEELWNGNVDNLPTKSQHRIVELGLRY
ncbi:hypothetical protein NE602_27630 [Bacteroides cellulosilyticus]|nr:hypothetical protein [Bacteroides cellulosilyticus]MCQ4947961.1 hypothetical protein [Bacteroides cellulosilyticus]